MESTGSAQIGHSFEHAVLDPLVTHLADAPDIQLVCQYLREHQAVRLNVLNSAKPAIVSVLGRILQSSAVWITPTERDAQEFAAELSLWTSPSRVLRFPSRNQIPYAREGVSTRASIERISTLISLADSDHPKIVVTSITALAERTLSSQDLLRGPGLLRCEDQVDLSNLLTTLSSSGYQLTSLVEKPGDFSRRGGIIDVYTPTANNPVRIEFFGDLIESIREFSLVDQRSKEGKQEVYLPPSSEWFASPTAMRSLADKISGAEDLQTQEDEALLRSGILSSPGRYGPLVLSSTLLDHIDSSTIIFAELRDDLQTQLIALDENASQRRNTLATSGEFSSQIPLPHVVGESLLAALWNYPNRVEFDPWLSGSDKNQLHLDFQSLEPFNGRLSEVAKNITRRLVRGDRVVSFTTQAQRLKEELDLENLTLEVESALVDKVEISEARLIQGSAPKGWSKQLADGELVFQTDREILGVRHGAIPAVKKTDVSHYSLDGISPGEYVVIAEFGVARFIGIIKRRVDQVDRDYLEMRFADDGKLFLPTDRPLRISKYIGPTARVPRLTHLGTGEWNKTRVRARNAVEVVAGQYLSLYAARSVKPGYAFSPDGEWQHELESAFPYVETIDQLEAIAAVKKDMETPKPMDRLICGDVGFGKTEIAIRAAFKAVMDGFQVVLLCPTTVLAQQHFNSFRERMAGFPVHIEMLSGFRTAKEARQIAAKVKAGEIDILIGTHRILEHSHRVVDPLVIDELNDKEEKPEPDTTVLDPEIPKRVRGVDFSNLGLAIIDEEQRFGVTHKDKLKEIRFEVDVLTLSATPIPRTLHMALAGIRDMSRVESAPLGRQSILTYVLGWDTEILQTAIRREIARGGQVYLVHNRVKTIDAFADEIRNLVPEARILVGHGQMPKWHLESVMREFIDLNADVLISTTIIESGLDISNVNTILIDRAQSLGLSQLYQLRGRVGRSDQQAYAYLFHHGSMTDIQQQRLTAIFESSELGSGLRVAQRDLELRGAGNLLGSQQSGHIAAIGLDLYMDMLAEAVERLKADLEGGKLELREIRQRQEALRAIKISLPTSGDIPDSFIPDIDERLSLYMRISMVTSLVTLEELEREIRDRYGVIPERLLTYFLLIKIRLMAYAAKLTAITHGGGKTVLESDPRAPFSGRKLSTDLPRSSKVGHLQMEIESQDLNDGNLKDIENLLRLLVT